MFLPGICCAPLAHVARTKVWVQQLLCTFPLSHSAAAPHLPNVDGSVPGKTSKASSLPPPHKKSFNASRPAAIPGKAIHQALPKNLEQCHVPSNASNSSTGARGEASNTCIVSLDNGFQVNLNGSMVGSGGKAARKLQNKLRSGGLGSEGACPAQQLR